MTSCAQQKNIRKISEVLRKVTEDICNSTVSTVYADDCRYGDNQIRIPLTCKVCIWRANCCLPLRLNGTLESGHVMHTARRSFPSRLQVYTVLHITHMNADLLLNIVDVGTFRNVYGKLVLYTKKTLCPSGLIILVRWKYVSQWFN